MLCTRREETASADQENLLKKNLDLLQRGSLYIGRSLINIREVLILALPITSASPHSISCYVPFVQELCRQIQSLHVLDLIWPFCDRTFDFHPPSHWTFGSHFLSILCLYHRPLHKIDTARHPLLTWPLERPKWLKLHQKFDQEHKFTALICGRM